MANATFNAGIDYFGLEDATDGALKVKSSAENRSKQSASGANSYGDIKAVDSWGETAAPTAEYQVVSECNSASFADIGGSIIDEPEGFTAPLCFGGLSFSTSNGTAPTMSANGQLVQADAPRLRKYSPVGFKILPRHRAQNCVGTWSGSGSSAVFTPCIEIKKGNVAASDIDDYGLESVSGDIMPVEFTLAQPKGETVNYDLHGGTATISYTMNWYAQKTVNGQIVVDPPTIALSSAAVAAGFTMSAPVGKSDPEGGYTQYTWSVSVPMVGSEYTTPAAA